MEMTISKREDRRRRIMEKGADRLALIKGQINTFSSSSSSSSSFYSASDILFDHPLEADPNPDDTAADGGVLKQRKHESGEKHSGGNAFDARQRTDSQATAKNTESTLVEKAAAAAAADDPQNETEPLISDPYYATYQSPYYFSSKQINASIVASENIRFMCAVVIGLLVVQSLTSFPLLNRKSIIASRPLYMLLVTDSAIVLGLLLLHKRRSARQGGDVKEDSSSGEGMEGGPTWLGAVKLLERGLVLHQTVRAVFIDCSVYFVIVVCGLSMI